jgi:malate dehydrogenase (oxaloacetate-decarboxylating)
MAIHSAQFSLILRIELERRPGTLGTLTSAIGAAGGQIGAVDILEQAERHTVRQLTVDFSSQEDWHEVLAAIEGLDGVRLVERTDRTLELHRGGKIFTGLNTPVKTRDDLAMAYTPGVARVCLEIADDAARAHEYTIRRNTVAVVSDGTAVLGLGDIGPEAALPVMEGKAVLFKEFAGVNAFPVCVSERDPGEIVETVKRIAASFGGINLEDISSPRCFEIERRLRDELDIPVFHDDQHGTAIVVLAALKNACRLTGRRLEDLTAVMIGAGAAGVAVARILLESGARSIVACDRAGAIHARRPDYVDGSMNVAKAWLAEHTNPDGREGSPAAVLEGADLFIGLSGPGIVRPEDLARMNTEPFVFAMANPDPEVLPEAARPHAGVVATGRSDYPNQINNVLAFPGVFRGALDARATTITEEMKLAAAEGIASVVADDELSDEYIIPSVFDRRVSVAVAVGGAREAERDGVSRGVAPPVAEPGEAPGAAREDVPTEEEAHTVGARLGSAA